MGKFLSNEIQDYLIDTKKLLWNQVLKLNQKFQLLILIHQNMNSKIIILYPTSSSSSLSQSFLEFQNEKIYHNFKEILEVPEKNSSSGTTTTTTTNKDSSRLFELPTGQSIVIDRFKIAESILIQQFINSPIQNYHSHPIMEKSQLLKLMNIVLFKRVRKMMMKKKKILINLLQNQKLILEVYHN